MSYPEEVITKKLKSMKLTAYKTEVAVDPNSIVEPSLKIALDDLESITKDKTIYSKICVFIFLLCDLSNDNPLVDRPYDKKREEALEIAFGSDLKKFTEMIESVPNLRDKVNRCIDVYLKDVNTDEQKDIATYSKKMDQFRIMLSKMSPVIERNVAENTGMVSFTTNMYIINSVLKDVVSLIQAKASMIALHTTGIVPKHLRGGLSPLSSGKIDIDEEN